MSSSPVRQTRLALATYDQLPQLHADDQHLCELLQARGLHTQACVWNDPAVDWRGFDAVLIRSIWDYFQHYEAYVSWLEQLRALGIPTLNPDAVLRWNSDKRYLKELAAAGVPIAQTRWLRGDQLSAALHGDRGEWVVKPAVSGGAWHTVRGVAGTAEFDQTLRALPAALEFLVQPYLPQIASAGEWSLLFFGGAFSHAVLKTPAAGDYRVQAQFGGRTEALAPPAHVLQAAQHALAITGQLLAEPLTYARVDGVEVDGGFVLMELELIEPYLFLGDHSGAAEQLADAVVAALDRRT